MTKVKKFPGLKAKKKVRPEDMLARALIAQLRHHEQTHKIHRIARIQAIILLLADTMVSDVIHFQSQGEEITIDDVLSQVPDVTEELSALISMALKNKLN